MTPWERLLETRASLAEFVDIWFGLGGVSLCVSLERQS